MTVNSTWTDPSEGGTMDLDVGDVLTEAVYDRILSNLVYIGGTTGTDGYAGAGSVTQYDLMFAASV